MFHSMLPRPGEKGGGVDYFVHRLANQMASRGHRVTFYTHTDRFPPDRGYTVQRVTRYSSFSNRSARLTAGAAALNRIDTSDLDVMHLHGDDWFYVNRKIPTVRSFYGSALREARTATSLKRKTVQTLVFGGELLASRLATGAYRCGPGMPAGYRLDGELLLAADVPAGLESNTRRRSAHPTILFVGTWEGRKRGRQLRDAFVRSVLPLHPTAELWMVSDRCEEGPNVRWLGHPTDAELVSLYQQAWVFCLPSAYEGFGLPYVEAMAYGTPVVTTPNPGALLISDRGQFARVGGLDEIGDILAELLADPAARSRLARLGFTRAQEFGWERACERHLEAYVAAISAHQHDRQGLRRTMRGS